MYLTCPRQYRYSYVDEIPSVPTAPLVFGRVLHECIRFAQDERLETRSLPPADRVLAEFDALWGKTLQEERPYCSQGKSALAGYAKSGREMLRLFLREQDGRPAPLAAEFPFEVEAGGHALCGVIDCVSEGETGLVITDYKSGRRKPSAEELERDLQLTVYAFAASQVFGRQVEKIAHIYLKDGSVAELERDARDFGWLLDEVLPHVARGIQAERFPLSPGLHCKWCDWRELCQAEQDMAQPAETRRGEATWLTPCN
jgi:putative RecB family exonuclease